MFALQASLVEPFEYGISISCAILGLCYLGTAHWLRSRDSEKVDLLIESFDGIGIALMSLFIPYLFDTMWTGIGWAIEGAALVVVRDAAATDVVTGKRVSIGNRCFCGICVWIRRYIRLGVFSFECSFSIYRVPGMLLPDSIGFVGTVFRAIGHVCRSIILALGRASKY